MADFESGHLELEAVGGIDLPSHGGRMPLLLVLGRGGRGAHRPAPPELPLGPTSAACKLPTECRAAAFGSAGSSPTSRSGQGELIYQINQEGKSGRASPRLLSGVFLRSSPSLLTRVLIATLPLPCKKDSQQSLGERQLLPPCSAQPHSSSGPSERPVPWQDVPVPALVS